MTDTDIGIPGDQQSLLFQSFEQADGSVSRRFGGIGLGLSFSKSMVEMMGVRIDCAKKGRAACEMSIENSDRYDIILMDIHIPEMDGYQATKNIRQIDLPRASSIPIVAVTANVYREDVEKCLTAGMNDHLGKPLDSSEVMNMLEKYFLDN